MQDVLHNILRFPAVQAQLVRTESKLGVVGYNSHREDAWGGVGYNPTSEPLLDMQKKVYSNESWVIWVNLTIIRQLKFLKLVLNEISLTQSPWFI